MIYSFGIQERTGHVEIDIGFDDSIAWSQTVGQGRSFVHAQSWRPGWPEFSCEVKSWHEEGDSPWPAKDFARTSGLSPRVRAVSKDALDRTDNLWGLVEVLPLNCRNGDYSAFHVHRHHDIFNRDASMIVRPNHERNRRFGTLGPVEIYDFDASELDEVDIFRVPELANIFCTQGFVDRLTDAGVTGWRVRQVYPPTDKQLAREQELLARRDKLHVPVGFGDQSMRTWRQSD